MEVNLKKLIQESLSVLLEGRLEDVKAKYADKQGSEQAIDQLSQGDPSGNNKYLEWMAKISFTDETSEFSVDDLLGVVRAYHEGLPRINSQFSTPVVDSNKEMFPGRAERRVKNNPKDINSYPTFNSLKLITDALEETKKERPDRDRIYQDERWTVIVPKSHPAACKYGIHSNWCVSTSNSSYFDRYTKERDALLFFIIWRNKRVETDKTEYKVAINAKYKEWDNPHDWDWYDMPDHTQDPNLMLNVFPAKMVETIQRYLVKEGKATGKIVDAKQVKKLIDDNATQILATSPRGTYFMTNNVEAFSNLEGYSDSTRWGRVDNINEGKMRVFISNSGEMSSTLIDWREGQDTNRLVSEWDSWSKYYKGEMSFFNRVHDIPDEAIVNQELKNTFDTRVKQVLQELGGMWNNTRTAYLKVGDRVRWKKGRGYWQQQRAEWNESIIDRQTPSGFFVTGKTDEFPKGKRFKPSHSTSMDVWVSFDGEIDLNKQEG
jgi:hypothetical protein